MGIRIFFLDEWEFLVLFNMACFVLQDMATNNLARYSISSLGYNREYYFIFLRKKSLLSGKKSSYKIPE